jgi:hypothetical protein
MQHRLSVALVLQFRHSKSRCVVRGQTWGSDDRLKGIRERSDGFVNYVVLLVSVVMCYCEWWEGEEYLDNWELRSKGCTGRMCCIVEIVC